jgi:ABC-type transport system involved in Fe-S cluster assembly fused permease/ATPase subunit
MKNFKTILYVIVLSILFRVDSIFADFWLGKVNSALKWSTDTLDQTIQTWLVYALGFLAVVMVIYWIYWGFLVLTSGWEDEGSKKWKKVLLQALLGLVIIFLAWPIVIFFLGSWGNPWIFTP